ncbi:unnamed protein product [Medioppia subpectinata]|uniref:C2H2-type domain-containing protein n=1 Tax=Medioppia subpectinata TaxID=1979941 RepID=A0A7R9KH47_9ACAR|nr:unnamed protein product [Medioppia subpectinata]CAG2103451.1 unnamed protein product [Medioppia subpectinata]
MSKRSKRSDELNDEEVVDNREDNTSNERLIGRLSVEDQESENGSDVGVDCDIGNDVSDGSVDENEGQEVLNLNDFLDNKSIKTSTLKRKRKTIAKTEVMEITDQSEDDMSREQTITAEALTSREMAAAGVVKAWNRSKGEAFVCDWFDCGRSYSNQSYLKEHQRLTHRPDADGQYNCRMIICSFKTPSAEDMADHWSEHKAHRLWADSQIQPDGKMPCGQLDCVYLSPKYSALIQHQLRVHPDVYPYWPWMECERPDCQYRTKAQRDIKRHADSHRQGDIEPKKRVHVYPTPKPIVTIDHRFGLKRKLTASKGPDGRYRCPWEGCDKSWAVRRGLTIHWRRNHTPDAVETMADWLVCPLPLCTFRAVSIPALTDHTDTHTAHRKAADDRRELMGKYQCDYRECAQQFVDYGRLLRHQLHKHPEAHTEWPWFECPHTDCEYMTKIRSLLRGHRSLHKRSKKAKEVLPMTPDGQFICDFVGCGKRFSRRDQLIRHKCVHRLTASVCGVDGCAATFKNPRQLRTHRWRQHNKGAQHCGHPGCDYRSGSLYTLKKHRLTHTGDKPFECELDDCSQAFRLEKMLTDHQKRVHWQHFPDLPWIQCTHIGCEWRTKLQTDFTTHAKSHTKPYKCSQCDKCFSVSEDLRRHRIRHDDSLKIPCHWPGCDKKFVRLAEMKRHLNAHSGERVYRCQWPGCDKQYVNEYSLSSHQKTTHNKTTGAAAETTVLRCHWPEYLSKRSKRRDQLNDKEVVDNREDNRCNKRSRGRISAEDKALDNESDVGVDCDVDSDSNDGSVDENEGQEVLRLSDKPNESTHVNENGDKNSGRIEFKSTLKQKLKTLFENEVKDSREQAIASEPSSRDMAAAQVVKARNRFINRPFVCDWFDCGRSYSRQTHLKEHQRLTHRPDADGQYNCRLKTCSFRTLSAENMADHSAHHKEHRLWADSQIQPDGKIPCGQPDCVQLSPTYSDLIVHQLRTHPDVYPYWPWLECSRTGCQYRTKCCRNNKSHADSHKEGEIEPKKAPAMRTVTIDHRFETKRKLTARKGPDGRYRCPWEGCDKSWTFRKSMTVHWRRYHTPDAMNATFACPLPLCTFRAVSMPALTDHTDTHTAHRKAADARRQSVGKYQCDYRECAQQFVDYGRLLRHQLDRHPEAHTEWPWFECSHTDCQYMTKIKSLLQRHLQFHKKPKKVSTKYPMTPDGQFICDFVGCGKRFPRRDQLTRHKLGHRCIPTVCGVDGCTATINNPRNLRIHRWHKHNKKPHPCGHPGCDYSTGSLFRINRHRLTHTGEKPFRCQMDGCGQAFGLNKFLTDHQKRVHWQHFPDLPWIECPHAGCQYRTKMVTDVRIHARTHTKPYKCSQCDKSFANSDDLTRHRIRHDDSLKIPCHWPGCDKKFVRLSEMKRHLNAHSGERVYRCLWPGCDKQYLNEYSLSYHQKSTHNKTTALPKETVLRCHWPECDYKTKNAGCLTNHLNKHQGIADYECTRLKVKA